MAPILVRWRGWLPSYNTNWEKISRHWGVWIWICSSTAANGGGHQPEEFGKTVGYMVFAFALALVLLYMVQASQFNSFIQPFIIMVAQPLAIVGGVMVLWLVGHTLNIYSMIGLVLLIGLVAKNSILLVDIINQRRVQGMDIDDALRDACPIRLRPVLMTSATIILALLPAALGLGAGAETNGPLAVAVIGGCCPPPYSR